MSKITPLVLEMLKQRLDDALTTGSTYPAPSKVIIDLIGDYEAQAARIAELEAENARLTELLRGDRMVVATRINHELTTAQRRVVELEAAINGCAGQWTPMQDGAHYCYCDEEDCIGEWRIENNGSRLVIGDGEGELSIELYDALRMCWQVQP